MTNLRDKIQDLLKNTSNSEVKALCEGYLKGDGSGALTEGLITGLRGLVSKDGDVAKLISETETFNQTKMGLEAQISKNAAARLQENWGNRRGQKTFNVGTDTTKLETDIRRAKEDGILLEGLQAVGAKDETIKSFIDKTSKDNYKIAESISAIRESQIASHPNVKYMLARYEKALNEGTAEYAIVKDFLSSITPFKWDKTVAKAFESVNTLVQDRASVIEVQNAINSIKASDGKRFYSDLTKKMNEWVYSDNKNVHDLTREIKGYMFNPIVKDLSNRLMLMENSKGTTFNVPVKDSNCSINRIYSPVLETTSGRVFQAGHNFYHSTDAGLSRLSTKQVNALPVKFLELCEAFSAAKVVDDKVTLYLGKAKIQMFEDKRIFINERQIDPSTLGSQLLYFTQINVFDKTSSVVNKIMNVYENLDNICEIDYGKEIVSNVFEGVATFVFKKGEKVFVNKVNKSMNENSFYKANPLQAVNMVKEFMSYNMSESLGAFLEGTYKKRADMQAQAQVVLSNITLVEADIEKLDKATLIDPTLNDVEEIKEAKSLLENELNNLKAEFQTINDEIKKFENIVKEEEEEEEDAEEVVVDEPEEDAPKGDEPVVSEEPTEDPTEVPTGEEPVVSEEPASTEPVSTEPIAAEVPAADPIATTVVEPAQVAATDLVSQGLAGAGGQQDLTIKGNDNLNVAPTQIPVQDDVVATGFNGAEGLQNTAPGQAATAIKQEVQPVPVITKGLENAPVNPTDNTQQIQTAAGNEPVEANPIQQPANTQVVAEVPAEEEPTTPMTGDAPDTDPAMEESETVETELGTDSKVKVLSRNETGVVTSINDGEYTVLLDNGDTIQCKQADLQNLADEVEATVSRNEQPVTENADDAGGEEGDDTENEQAMYVTATMTIDLGPFKQGDQVEIDSTGYTSGGEDDPVKLKEPKDGVSEVPKKYLKLADASISPSQEMGDVQTKAENLLKGLEELETFLNTEDKISGKGIGEAKEKLKSFVDALAKEKSEVPSEE